MATDSLIGLAEVMVCDEQISEGERRRNEPSEGATLRL